jgi:hypothetical protein
MKDSAPLDLVNENIFQQDGTTSICAMKLLLPNEVISKNWDISWLVRSADLLLSDSFFGAT